MYKYAMHTPSDDVAGIVRGKYLYCFPLRARHS